MFNVYGCDMILTRRLSLPVFYTHTAYVEPFEVQPGYIYDTSSMQRGTGGGYGSSNIQGGWYK